MNFFLSLAFLFFVGSVTGWVIEVFYRRFFSKTNTARKWINPGFCTGPYLPLYGSGLCLMYLLSCLDSFSLTKYHALNTVLLLLLMALCMTALEYVTGMVMLRSTKVRLWDYRNEWGNIHGVICPKFSLAWGLLCAAYYFLINPYIRQLLVWLSRNLAFSFVIGLFFGVFIIDAAHSANIVAKLSAYAKEKQIVFLYEEVKSKIQAKNAEYQQKYHFFRPFKTDVPMKEILGEMVENIEEKISSVHTRKKTK